MVLEIVQCSFCKSQLELVVVVPICIFAVCTLYPGFCGLCYGPFTVSSFVGTKFDILWHAMLGPICGSCIYFIMLI